MKKKTIILLWLVTAYSCSNYSSRLKAVLDYSGTNRAELEKVLDHYSQDPADSLKLKASIFQIENMPGHYTFGAPYMRLSRVCFLKRSIDDLLLKSKYILKKREKFFGKIQFYKVQLADLYKMCNPV